MESIGQLLSSEGRKLPSGAHCSRSLTHAENGEEAEENPAEHVSAVSDDTFTIADATKKDLMETLMARTLDNRSSITNTAVCTIATVLHWRQ